MKVKITTVGALSRSLPEGRDCLEGDGLTVAEALDALIEKHGPVLAEELMKDGTLRPGLSLLINGRNVLSLPQKFSTPLKDEDRIMIALLVAGG